jgi:hypothetical protein
MSTPFTRSSPAITRWPYTVFQTDRDHLFEFQLVYLLERCARSNSPLQDEHLERLSWYPKRVSQLILEESFAPSTIDVLLRNPLYAYLVLAPEYEKLSDLIEPRLFNDLEVVEQLVVYYRKIYDSNGLKMRTYLNIPEYLKLLQEDPVRYLRVMYNVDVEVATQKIESQVSSKLLLSPAWTFYALSTRKVVTVPVEMVESLVRSEEYAFRTLHHLAFAQIPCYEELKGMLVDAIVSPRWAFHVLSHRVPLTESQYQRLYGVLAGSPPWMAELAEVLNWEGAELDNCQMACVEASSRAHHHHVVLPEFLHWYRERATLRRVSRMRIPTLSSPRAA